MKLNILVLSSLSIIQACSSVPNSNSASRQNEVKIYHISTVGYDSRYEVLRNNVEKSLTDHGLIIAHVPNDLNDEQKKLITIQLKILHSPLSSKNNSSNLQILAEIFEENNDRAIASLNEDLKEIGNSKKSTSDQALRELSNKISNRLLSKFEESN